MRVVLLIVLLFFFFSLQYRLWFGYGNLQDKWQLEKEIAGKELKIKEIEQSNRRLMKEINARKKDPNAVENLARRRLGMIKEGEIFYQVLENADADHDASP